MTDEELHREILQRLSTLEERNEQQHSQMIDRWDGVISRLDRINGNVARHEQDIQKVKTVYRVLSVIAAGVLSVFGLVLAFIK